MMKFIKPIACVLILCIGCLLSAVAQTPAGAGQKTVVKGKIVDKTTKAPIVGVSVTEIDADKRIVKGTATDIEGNFVLRIANPKNKINVSYIGYKTITQSFNGRTNINFQLEDESSSMGEVIIVSSRNTDNGMMNIRERSSTIASAKISAKDLEELPAASIDQALQGRLSGVDITATSGDPGAAMNIRIRGISSISSTGTPLIVVDGMPYETEIPGDF